MFNSPIAKSKRTGYKRFKKAAFGKKSNPQAAGGACLYCGYFTSFNALVLDDVRIQSLKRLNKNCVSLWICEKHVEPLLTLRWSDLLFEITS